MAKTSSDRQAEPQLPLRTTYVLGRLSRIVQRLLEQTLEPYDLTLPEYTVLAVLRRRAGLSNAQLARRAYIRPQSMHEVLSRLEARGIVRRTESPVNRRIRTAVLTGSGARLIEAAENDAARIDEKLLSGLTEFERTIFVKALRKCIVGLGGGLRL